MSATEPEICSRVDRLLEANLADRRDFLGTQYDLGLAWVHFPEEGRGLEHGALQLTVPCS